MEKTISINLSGQNFQIEEEAYEKLAAYLESIKRHCGAGADAAEVVSDIENSMAEKLKSSLAPYKEVVTVSDVESLIKIMGTTEDFDREVGETHAPDQPENQDHKAKRKLYRDTDNAVIGGVAAGLGAYFDIDPVIFRIIFCALVFIGGSAFPIYIILWIAMPEAKTAHQKLEMHGQTPTLAAFKNLAKTGEKLKENWQKRWKNSSALDKIINLPLLILSGLFRALKKIWSILWPLLKFFFGLGLVLLSLIFLGAIGVGSLFLLLYNDAAYQLAFVPISHLTRLMPYTLLVISGFLSLAIPSTLILIGGLAILRRKRLINFAAGSIMVGVWMAAAIFFCAAGLRYFPEVASKISSHPLAARTEQSVDLAGITEINADGHLINIRVSASTSTPAAIVGRKVDLDSIMIEHEGHTLRLTGKPSTIDRNICFACHLRPIELTVATSTDLKISVTGGASIEDETEMKAEETDTRF